MNSKSKKYKRIKHIGIVLIGILVLTQDVLSSILDHYISISHDETYGLRYLFYSNLVVSLGLLGFFITALGMLISATRTMDKIDVTRGEESKSKIGVKTINLNIYAAILQLISYLFWLVGSLLVDMKFVKAALVFERTIISTISSTLAFVSLYILIHVFYHYGLNIEQTMERRKQREEERKRKEEEQKIKEVMCSEFPEITDEV